MSEADGVLEGGGGPQATPQTGPLAHSNVSFEGLEENQISGIMALLSEPTITRAALLVGVDERTLRRWLEEPAFKKAYLASRREAFGHAMGLLQRYAPVAVNVLMKVINDPKTPPGVKVSAATNMLKLGREGIELEDLAQRVEFLENAAAMTANWQGHR